ncbi:MAG TPA: hypothetical protein VM681_00825 [Candidatus Thermoplasmatota archaeon]|nr:hypothetical protein [Candidatus Thermoplasmatota archaeon]
MMIRTNAEKRLLDEAKEIKVKIPLDYHIKLHTLKVLRGQSISDTVEMALGRYFSDINAAPAAVQGGMLPQPDFEHPL